MLNWLKNIFNCKKSDKQVALPSIEHIKITTHWNAHPVSPEIELTVDKIDLIISVYLNHYQFDQFNEGDKVYIKFKNCSKYSLNSCNDEGFYYGQYRIKSTELAWGEFYEITNGLDRKLPEPVVNISEDDLDKKHYIFFFKDYTFECLASQYELKFSNSNKLYKVVLEDHEIGTTMLEKADAPMGVVFGLIEFKGIESPYKFFKDYCLKNNIIINTDAPEVECIATQVISELKVFRQDGMEIKGTIGNTITGMKSEGYEISILGIPYPFYEEEFPHHVQEYHKLFDKRK